VRALCIEGRGSVRQAELPDPVPGDDEALVAPRHVGLCGTDLELFDGSMPYLASGDAAYPIQPGHEVAGVVVASPDPGIPAGTAVLVDPVAGCGACQACAAGLATRCPDRRELGLRRGMPGGASELVAVPVGNLHALPAGVSTREAVLAEPGVTALNAVERLGDVSGRRALVVGAGTLGLIAAQLLCGRGVEVDVLVVEAERAALVERLGVRPISDPPTAGYAAVVEASGAPVALRGSLNTVAAGGRIAVIGIQSGPVDALDVNQLVLKDATLQGVLNGPGLYADMLEALAGGAVDAAALIDAEFDLADAEAALTRLAEPGRAAPKVLLRI
jgi:2-desacetyl-2-hydroxyethyl bacteriochlorophyllide A dehydrogenase